MERLIACLEAGDARLRQESRRLAAGGRGDEGDLAKIRANVYGICKSVFQTLGPERGKTRLTELKSTWETALFAAREHGDVKKAVIEEIKLETLAEIGTELERVKEV